MSIESKRHILQSCRVELNSLLNRNNCRLEDSNGEPEVYLANSETGEYTPVYDQPLISSCNDYSDKPNYWEAINAYISLRIEAVKAGTPPHTDYWHQSFYDAEKAIDEAIAKWVKKD